MERAGGWRADARQYVLTDRTAETVDCAISDYAIFAGLNCYKCCSIYCTFLEANLFLDLLLTIR